MKFRELYDLYNSICEHRWDEDGLVVIVNDYEFTDFMKVLKGYRGIFDDEPIKAFIGNGYVSIPGFEQYLEMMGVDPEEFKEIFEE